MDRKRMLLVLILLVVAVAVAAMVFWNSRYTPIDAWSAALTAENVEWAAVSRGYGIEKISYDVPTEEYGDTITVLKTVTEKNSTRKAPENSERNEHNLAFYYEGRLWLFQCRENGCVSLTFEDAETGALYGCEGKLLYINSPELWNYIMDTVNTKAK